MTSLTLTIPVADGALVPSLSQKEALSRYLHTRDGRAVAVKLSVPTSTRSLNQNKWYWGVVLAVIAEATGNSTEDLHLVLKDMFLPRKFLTLGAKEVEVRKTTADLSTAEFKDFTQRIAAWSAQELGIIIPEPN